MIERHAQTTDVALPARLQSNQEKLLRHSQVRSDMYGPFIATCMHMAHVYYLAANAVKARDRYATALIHTSSHGVSTLHKNAALLNFLQCCLASVCNAAVKA